MKWADCVVISDAFCRGKTGKLQTRLLEQSKIKGPLRTVLDNTFPELFVILSIFGVCKHVLKYKNVVNNKLCFRFYGVKDL